MNSVEGFILVGGRSRRMGTDKARLMLAGQTFVERIAQELSAVTPSVSIVGGIAGGTVSIVGGSSDSPIPTEAGAPASELKTQNSKLKTLETFPDVYPNWGALGGVHTALAACRAEWALTVACDFPFVTSDLFARLLSLRGDFDAVAPVQRDEIPQPLCTLYRVQPCRERAEELIKTGERKPVALLQSVRTRWVTFSELVDLNGAHRFFDNINTPEDYARVSGEGVDSRDAGVS